MVSRLLWAVLCIWGHSLRCRMVSRLLWRFSGFEVTHFAAGWFRAYWGGDLDLSSLTSLPDGFAPIVGGDLDLRSLTSLPDGFAPSVGGYLVWGHSLRCRMVSRLLWAVLCIWGSLTSLPDGFAPTVGGSLDLRSLTSLPDGFAPTVGGYLDLRSLTSLPDGFAPTVGGSLYLRSLTSLPDGFAPTRAVLWIWGHSLRCRMVSRLLWAVIWIWVHSLRCRMVSRLLGRWSGFEVTHFAAGWFRAYHRRLSGFEVTHFASLGWFRAYCGRWSGFEFTHFAAGWFRAYCGRFSVLEWPEKQTYIGKSRFLFLRYQKLKYHRLNCHGKKASSRRSMAFLWGRNSPCNQRRYNHYSGKKGWIKWVLLYCQKDKFSAHGETMDKAIEDLNFKVIAEKAKEGAHQCRYHHYAKTLPNNNRSVRVWSTWVDEIKQHYCWADKASELLPVVKARQVLMGLNDSRS